MACSVSPTRERSPGQNASSDWKIGIVTEPCLIAAQKYQSSWFKCLSTATQPTGVLKSSLYQGGFKQLNIGGGAERKKKWTCLYCLDPMSDENFSLPFPPATSLFLSFWI